MACRSAQMNWKFLSAEPVVTSMFRASMMKSAYLAGWQSGKTSIIAALIALYEAFRDHRVRPGQRAYVLIIAPVIQQAEIAFKFIRQYLLESPILQQYVSKITKDEIELKFGIPIAGRPSYISIRGVPVVCAILDELAFWNHEPNSANPE
jgi:phage terminase large subunit-like protein